MTFNEDSTMYHSTPKRESIDSIDIDKEISRILKAAPCKNKTNTVVDTEAENEFENFFE